MTTRAPELDGVIVGAGFGGLYMLHRLRGMGLSARIVEAAGGLGGTWYWNRYPGARCDVESMQYSYQFDDDLQHEWEWTERYATQPEILRYAEHVADRFDLRRDIQFNTRVKSAVFDEAAGRWTILTDDGAETSASFCIMATGCLSAINLPNFAGAESFQGAIYLTSRWPHHEVDFTGQRVGIIGTGSSAIQSIPLIAEQAAHLHVFQRSPNYSVPAHNARLDPREVRDIKDNYKALRALARTVGGGLYYPTNEVAALEVDADERQRVYEERWAFGGVTFMDSFADLLLDAEANATAAEFVRGKIREIVNEPAVAELLSPRDVIGCKRLCVDTGYYATFNRDNVTLVDVSTTPIEALTAAGLRVNGRDYAFDAIIFATGFDAMTPGLARQVGRGAAHLSGFPQSVHHHRARQARRCSPTWCPASSSTWSGSAIASALWPDGVPRGSKRRSRPRTNGSPATAKWPRATCARPAIPGTSAPTSPASRAFLRPISAACRATSRSASG